MTENQRKELTQLAKDVKSSYKSLTEPEIIGRVMIISGRKFVAACKGYQIMVAEKMLDGFVSREGYGALAKMIANNPLVGDLFETLDLVPQKCEIFALTGWERPKRWSIERLTTKLPEAEF